MDKNSGLNRPPLPSGSVPPCATQVGREFLQKYYLTLSEKPQDANLFYSNDAAFVHADFEATGQEEIRRVIDMIGFDDCKTLIHTTKGAHSREGDWITLQVCGEMQVNERSEVRRFIQSVVLCQQKPQRNYYVQSNIFQFADACFNPLPKEEKTPSSPVEANADSPKTPVMDKSRQGTAAEKFAKVKPDNQHVKSDNQHAKKERESKPTKEEKKVEVAATPIRTAAREPTTAPATTPAMSEPKPVATSTAPPPASVKEEPKTWAKLVEGGGSAAPSTASPPKKAAPSPSKNVPPPKKDERSVEKTEERPVEKKDEKKKVDEKPKEKEQSKDGNDQPERGSKLYIGGITRNKIPLVADENTVIAEIFSVFSAYGEVEHVQCPRKCFEAPINTLRPGTAFAFVAMKNLAEAQKVFDACRKDDSKASVLNAIIPSFGFNGEVSVTISEPRSSPQNRGGYRGGRGGPMGGGGRGSYTPRGSSRGGGRGYHQHSNY